MEEVRDILGRRAGEEMALNDQYLNPQLGRIVRTLGFDRTWVQGDGAVPLDEAAHRRREAGGETSGGEQGDAADGHGWLPVFAMARRQVAHTLVRYQT